MVIFDDDTQNSPVWEHRFEQQKVYDVFIESGTAVDVHLQGENQDNFFNECASSCYFEGEGISGHS